ncbi:MAG: hypothetical protein AB7O62_06660 [Pirellulales bacterium]
MKTTYRCVMAVMALAVVGESGFADDAARLARLRELWERQKAEVVSGEFRLRYLFRGTPYLQPIEPSEIFSLIETDEFSTSRDLQAAFLKRVALPMPVLKDQWWTVSLVLSGGKAKQEYLDDEPELAGATFESSYDGETQVTKDRRQATITRGRSPVHIMNVGEIRWIPALLDDAEILSTEQAGVVRVRQSGGDYSGEMLIDEATGMALRLDMFNSQGQLAVALRQYQPTVHAGDVVLPAVSAKATYIDGQPATLAVVIVESATLNEQVNDEKFLVAANPGTVVVDKRESTTKPKIDKVGQATADVLTFVPARALPHPRSYKLPWLAGGGAIVILLAAYLYKKYRRGPSAAAM